MDTPADLTTIPALLYREHRGESHTDWGGGGVSTSFTEKIALALPEKPTKAAK